MGWGLFPAGKGLAGKTRRHEGFPAGMGLAGKDTKDSLRECFWDTDWTDLTDGHGFDFLRKWGWRGNRKDGMDSLREWGWNTACPDFSGDCTD